MRTNLVHLNARMSIVNIRDAKTHFSYLVDRAAAGEEIVIAKAGKPVARLMPLARPQRAKRRLGLANGKLRVGRIRTRFAKPWLSN